MAPARHITTGLERTGHWAYWTPETRFNHKIALLVRSLSPTNAHMLLAKSALGLT